jgi:Flp pilus assembly protein TadD
VALETAVPAGQPSPSKLELRRFPATDMAENARDLGLAWETLADGGMSEALLQAEKYLQKALGERPDDPALLTALGFLLQKRGKMAQARQLDEHALRVDAHIPVAETNLGVIEAQSGSLSKAIELWKAAFGQEPGRSSIGMNLAKLLCAEGKAGEARDAVKRVLQFNPDYPEGKKLLQQLESGPSACALR